MSDLAAILNGERPKPRARRSGFMGHPLVQLTLVRFREFVREPEAIFWVFVFPLLLAAGLGIAFRNRPPEVLEVAATTPEIARALGAEKMLGVRQLNPAQADQALRTGKVALVAAAGQNGGVVYRLDDTNPEGRNARMLADAAVQRAAGRRDPVPAADLHLREPGSRYIDFLVPGLLGMNVMGSAMWGLGFAIVDARRKKLIKRLVATPMPRGYYLLSFLLSRLSLLVLEVGVLLGFGYFAFGVPLRGSMVELAALSVMGSLAFCSIGLLVAARAQTMEAASGMMNVVMMPMWIVSGVFFSSQRFPAALQPVIQALPLTALIDGLRANMLRGSGIAEVGPQFAILGAWLLVAFPVALKIFRWR